ncbi:helix-turn-helix transcriptional regulator [Microbacterium sp. NPDC087589]|uniref:helix-turn-helix transcriptional regulator n=1 Tax=Microbacterium sp. NPDC087589 TaxID=3364191 RepID=UPI00382DF4B2
MNSRLLKVTEVAETLGVSRAWVYRRIEAGELPVVELGNTRKNQRIDETDLAEFISTRKRSASAI